MSRIKSHLSSRTLIALCLLVSASCFKELKPITKSPDENTPMDSGFGETHTDASGDSYRDAPLDHTGPQEIITNPKATKALGEGCTGNLDCKSNFCMDGLCCESACAGICQSCKQSHTGKPDGVCAAISSGKDPYDVCADERSANECGFDGVCDGAGACRKVDTSHVCRPAACLESQFTPAATCDGLGACRKPQAVDCGAFQCSPSEGCKKTCISHIDCGTNSYCDPQTKTCSVKRVEGKACTTLDECTSGFCADGVCCKTACSELCKACVETYTGQPSGTCYNVKLATDPKNVCAKDTTDPCGNDGFCDGVGACAKAGTSEICAPAACNAESFTPVATCDGKGACKKVTTVDCGAFGCNLEGCKKSCTKTADCAVDSYCDTAKQQCSAKKVDGSACQTSEECTAGFCVDGVCCKTACTEGCYACSNALTGQASGTCKPVTDGSDPKNKCTPDTKNVCGDDGYCDGAGACRKAKATLECGNASCDADNNFIAASFCNGSGACNLAKVTNCGTVACSSTQGCLTSCTTDSQCLDGNYCLAKVCVPKKKLGGSCTLKNQCESGNCIDGVCCDSTCASICMACNVSGKAGQCSAIPTGQGLDECPKDIATCHTGGCDGYGSCLVATKTTYYRDADGDEYGNKNTSQSACQKPDGYVTDNKDCDDANPNLHPGSKTCNGISTAECSATGTVTYTACTNGCWAGVCRPSTDGTIGVPGAVSCKDLTKRCQGTDWCASDSPGQVPICLEDRSASTWNYGPLYQCDAVSDCAIGQICCLTFPGDHIEIRTDCRSQTQCAAGASNPDYQQWIVCDPKDTGYCISVGLPSTSCKKSTLHAAGFYTCQQ